MSRRHGALAALPVEGDTVQMMSGSAWEVGEIAPRAVGFGIEVGPTTKTKWPVHLPVICEELEPVNEIAPPALDADDLRPGIELEAGRTAPIPTMFLPPYVAVLRDQSIW